MGGGDLGGAGRISRVDIIREDGKLSKREEFEIHRLDKTPSVTLTVLETPGIPLTVWPNLH